MWAFNGSQLRVSLPLSVLMFAHILSSLIGFQELHMTKKKKGFEAYTMTFLNT
jgi:hypothetical protein